MKKIQTSVILFMSTGVEFNPFFFIKKNKEEDRRQKKKNNWNERDENERNIILINTVLR